MPAPLPSSAGPLEAVGAPPSDFALLTKIPIVIYYGDNIPQTPSANPGQDGWRVRLAMARLWADAVNRRGGDVTLVTFEPGARTAWHSHPLGQRLIVTAGAGWVQQGAVRCW